MSFDFMKYFCELRQKEYDESGYVTIYPEYCKEEIMLPMKDGVKLRTLIYKPALEDKLPVSASLPIILERTCYPQQERISKINGENLAKRGYLFVSQYCRGTGGSEGAWEPNINERSDGLDTIQWLNAQDWTSSIGYWGNSYLAATGWAIADKVPEKVKGMCLTHYGTDRFKSAYEKGMFRQDVLTSWAMENAGFSVSADYIESCKFMPQVEVDEKLWGRRIDWYRDWITNTYREDPYWQQGWWKELYDITAQVKVPLYIRSGWYDHHHGSTMNTWDNLNHETKQHCWLDIGGWNHSFLPCMEDSTTEQLRSSEVRAILEWFELVLKQNKHPDHRVRAYVIGADRWLECPQWPITDQDIYRIYFKIKNENQKLGKEMGILTTKVNREVQEVSYQYDPKDPLPSHGAESLLRNMKNNGNLLQPEPGYRQDVLSFLSEPLQEDLYILGKVKVILYVSSDCPDTAFTAKLMEVRADGRAYSIRSSITGLCHDIGHAYEPGTIEQVTIDLWDIAYKVKKGSRVRIDISSSDFPQYHIHCNYAGIWAMQEREQTAQQKVYCGGEYPSVIEIPIRKE